MPTLIISDLHLANDDDINSKRLIRFCQAQQNKAKRLFILGDLFDYWLGDDVSSAQHKKLIQAFKQLTLPVFFMPGNRDFLVSDVFYQQSGIQALSEPYILKDYQKHYLLMHGDALCSDDVAYQRFKKVVRQKTIKKMFLSLPKNWRTTIAKQLRQTSKNQAKNKSDAIMDVNEKTLQQLMTDYGGCDIIHGHTHRQATHHYPNYKRYVLGDWQINQGNGFIVDDSGVRLIEIL